MQSTEIISKNSPRYAEWLAVFGIDQVPIVNILVPNKANVILQAAEAAQTDAVLFDYFTNTLGSTPEMFAKFIQDFLALRERKTNA